MKIDIDTNNKSMVIISTEEYNHLRDFETAMTDSHLILTTTGPRNTEYPIIKRYFARDEAIKIMNAEFKVNQDKYDKIIKAANDRDIASYKTIKDLKSKLSKSYSQEEVTEFITWIIENFINLSKKGIRHLKKDNSSFIYDAVQKISLIRLEHNIHQ